MNQPLADTLSPEAIEEASRRYAEAVADGRADEFLDSPVNLEDLGVSVDNEGTDEESEDITPADTEDEISEEETDTPVSDGSEDVSEDVVDEDTSADEGGDESPPDYEALYAQATKNHENATKKISEQGAELSELRKQVESSAPILQMLSDPNTLAQLAQAQQQPSGQQQFPYLETPQRPPIPPAGDTFDFTDPAQHVALAEQAASRTIQQVLGGIARKSQMDKQRQMVDSFQASRKATREKLMTGDAPLAAEDIDAAEKTFHTMLMKDYTGTAVRAVSFEEQLKAAEKRGRESAFNEMKTRKGGAKRLTNRSNRRHGKTSEDVKNKPVSEMSRKQLQDTLKIEPLGSERHDQALKEAQERLRKEEGG